MRALSAATADWDGVVAAAAASRAALLFAFVVDEPTPTADGPLSDEVGDGDGDDDVAAAAAANGDKYDKNEAGSPPFSAAAAAAACSWS